MLWKLQMLYVKQRPSKLVSNNTFKIIVKFTRKTLHLQSQIDIQLYTVKGINIFRKSNYYYIL